MSLYWGVIPLQEVPSEDSESTLAAITRWGCEAGVLAPGDYVVLVAGLGLHTGSHNSVMVHLVP